MRGNRRYKKFIYLIYIVLDFFVINFSFFLSGFLFFKDLSWLNSRYLVVLMLYNFLWYVSLFIFKGYETKHIFKLSKVLIRSFKAIIFHLLLLSLVIFIFQFSFYSRLTFISTYGFLFILVPLVRLLILNGLRYYRERGYNFKNIVVVGAGPVGNQIYQFLKSEDNLGYRFLGFFDDNPEKALLKEKIIGPIDKLEQFIHDHPVDEIFCALALTNGKKIQELINIADKNVIRLRIIPDFRGFLWKAKRINLSFFNDVPVLTIREEPLEMLRNRLIKRGFDIAFSLMVILLFMPVLLPLISLLVKLSSSGPVFFKQQRTGKNNQNFYCYKFRTMTVNKESDKMQATKNDVRVTKVGAFLRKSNLDEIPQFFNVLIGEMSVVGPRPHMLKHTEQYGALIKKYMVRHFIKPGITGWAQVNGYRGPTSDSRLMEKRVKYDVWYMENWSIWLDLRIIYMTAFNMAKGEENAF